mmetsp:Transcript_15988/g.64498  ORF Transcript_15988/g.64498 Transcript_15988/m.64498 type:complete len:217 (+) Transcript_15988:1290-1940(+)
MGCVDDGERAVLQPAAPGSSVRSTVDGRPARRRGQLLLARGVRRARERVVVFGADGRSSRRRAGRVVRALRRRGSAEERRRGARDDRRRRHRAAVAEDLVDDLRRVPVVVVDVGDLERLGRERRRTLAELAVDHRDARDGEMVRHRRREPVDERRRGSRVGEAEVAPQRDAAVDDGVVAEVAASSEGLVGRMVGREDRVVEQLVPRLCGLLLLLHR